MHYPPCLLSVTADVDTDKNIVTAERLVFFRHRSTDKASYPYQNLLAIMNSFLIIGCSSKAFKLVLIKPLFKKQIIIQLSNCVIVSNTPF